MIGPRTTPIGLDIGARRIKAAQWTLSRAGARLTAAACIDRAAPGAPLNADEAASIRGVLERQGFAGRRVVASAPATRVLTSVLELPPKSSGAPLEHIARIELARANGVSPDGMEMAQWELPSGTRAVEGTHVFAIALRHADADAMLDALEAAGLHAKAIDMGLLGLARLAIRQNNQGERAVTGLLDLGASARRSPCCTAERWYTSARSRTWGSSGCTRGSWNRCASSRMSPRTSCRASGSRPN